MDSIYKCPVCGGQLQKKENVFVCYRNHSYDIAKQGYVNLLLANQKRTKDPGDNKAMVENREYFLEQGYYDDLSKKLNEIILETLSESDGLANILDLGCGEGFYIARLKTMLKEKHRDKVQLWGIDISKSAIQKASKKHRKMQFCIGTNFQLPYLNESVNTIFSIFSPFDAQELMRVLKPGGKMIVVRPGPSHLKELASLIYEKFELQGNGPNVAEKLDLQPLEMFEVKYQMHLKNKRDIESLVGMTPYFWSLSEEKKLLLAQQQELTVTADFQLSLFQK